MSVSSFEKQMEKELQQVVRRKDIKWLEWSTTEAQVKKNLRQGEEMVYLSKTSVWVAYKPI